MTGNLHTMLADIEREVEFTRNAIGKNAFDEQVMRVMGEVPRDLFVPPELRSHAFDNGPLPIGHGQTISQPYIVALMTDLLALESHHVVLEIGTGSGYQTAVLSCLCRKVYSVELVAELSAAATRLLNEAGYRNIETRSGDGYAGWPEHAPYDGIIVTAAATHIPPALLEQLKPGGRLVIPVGPPHQYQELLLVRKDLDGKTSIQDLLGVAFVPLRETQDVPHGEGTAH
jgi:protein-L-isoaspartate(D-aspartate) O-methyltransferase